MLPKINISSSGKSTLETYKYRKDIDGLRAVAVLSVVIYHLSKEALPGGYLGVDVFFVISGYLITTIIFKEIANQQFSIVAFYKRRIRRIMPALLVVLAVTTVASIALLLPTDLISYSKSLLATLAFVANIYFWRDTGYFSANAEQKPLLHVWSLGVEEQFYIFFPIVILFGVRYFRHHLLALISFIAMCSLLMNVIFLYYDGDNPAFFLSPTRVWELAAGALITFLPPVSQPRHSIAIISSVFAVGLLVMGLAFKLPYPFFIPTALPVVIATAILIFVGTSPYKKIGVNVILSTKFLVFIGLISFSLYLWHWPVITLLKYFLVRDLHPQEMVATFIVLIVLSWLSYKYIEKPFRKSNSHKTIPMKRVMIITSSGVALIALSAFYILAHNGLPTRLNKQASIINASVGTAYRCPVSKYMAFGASRACELNLPSRDIQDAQVILLGNSHAQMYAPVWRSILEDHHLNGALVNITGCLPTVQANISKKCIKAAKTNLTEVLKLKNAKTVILGLSWWDDLLLNAAGDSLDNTQGQALNMAMDDLVYTLISNNKRVIIIGPIAYPQWNVASVVSRKLAYHRTIDEPLFYPADKFKNRYNSTFTRYELHPEITFLRPDRIQCSTERCEYIVDDHSLFADMNHLAEGEIYRYREMFEKGFINSSLGTNLPKN